MHHKQTKQFQKRIEDFTCEACGEQVHGDGYRNHCPRCLLSKHVDVYPGDRQADCGGLMDVVDVVLKHGSPILVHECRRCGHQKRNRMHSDDQQDALIATMKNIQSR